MIKYVSINESYPAVFDMADEEADADSAAEGRAGQGRLRTARVRARRQDGLRHVRREERVPGAGRR